MYYSHTGPQILRFVCKGLYLPKRICSGSDYHNTPTVVSAMLTRCVLYMSIFCLVHIILSPVNPTCLVCFGSKYLFCTFSFFLIPPVPPTSSQLPPYQVNSGAVRHCRFPRPKNPAGLNFQFMSVRHFSCSAVTAAPP